MSTEKREKKNVGSGAQIRDPKFGKGKRFMYCDESGENAVLMVT